MRLKGVAITMSHAYIPNAKGLSASEKTQNTRKADTTNTAALRKSRENQSMSQGIGHTLLANSKNSSFDLLQEKSQLVKKINPSSSICLNIIAADRPLFFDSRQPASTHAKHMKFIMLADAV